MSPERPAGLPDPDAARQAISEVRPALAPGIPRLARVHAESLRSFTESLGLRPVEKRRAAVAVMAGIIDTGRTRFSRSLRGEISWEGQLWVILHGVGPDPEGIVRMLALPHDLSRLRERYTSVDRIPHDELKPVVVALHERLVALGDDATRSIPPAPPLPEWHPPESARLAKGASAEQVAERLAALIAAGLDEHRMIMEGSWSGPPRQLVLPGSGGQRTRLGYGFYEVLDRAFAELDLAGLYQKSDISRRYQEATRGFYLLEELADPSVLPTRVASDVRGITEEARPAIIKAYAGYLAIAVNYLAETLDLKPVWERR